MGPAETPYNGDALTSREAVVNLCRRFAELIAALSTQA